jgi:hypothetical protein
MPKGYWKASRQLLKDIGSPYTLPQLIGEEAELPSNYWQKHGNFRLFPLKRCISVYINKKI